MQPILRKGFYPITAETSVNYMSCNSLFGGLSGVGAQNTVTKTLTEASFEGTKEISQIHKYYKEREREYLKMVD